MEQGLDVGTADAEEEDEEEGAQAEVLQSFRKTIESQTMTTIYGLGGKKALTVVRIMKKKNGYWMHSVYNSGV